MSRISAGVTGGWAGERTRSEAPPDVKASRGRRAREASAARQGPPPNTAKREIARRILPGCEAAARLACRGVKAQRRLLRRLSHLANHRRPRQLPTANCQLPAPPLNCLFPLPRSHPGGHGLQYPTLCAAICICVLLAVFLLAVQAARDEWGVKKMHGLLVCRSFARAPAAACLHRKRGSALAAGRERGRARSRRRRVGETRRGAQRESGVGSCAQTQTATGCTAAPKFHRAGRYRARARS